MRPTIKASPVRTKAPAKAPAPMERVLEACAEMLASTGELPLLRQRIAESVQQIFQAAVAGIMVHERESYLPAAVCTPAGGPASAKALMEHARSFAAQAIEQNRQLSFRFSYRSDESEAIYHGLAQPILTNGSVAAFLVLRSSVFAPAEVSSFAMMGNIGR